MNGFSVEICIPIWRQFFKLDCFSLSRLALASESLHCNKLWFVSRHLSLQVPCHRIRSNRIINLSVHLPGLKRKTITPPLFFALSGLLFALFIANHRRIGNMFPVSNGAAAIIALPGFYCPLIALFMWTGRNI